MFGARARGQAIDPVRQAEEFRQRSDDAEAKGLAQPFKGVTKDGRVIPDLFHVAPSGVPTEDVRNAARAFLATLSDPQLVRTVFPVDDVQWRKWANQNYYARWGISLQEMDPRQRGAALALLRTSLSDKGFELTRNIMRLNETLAELTGSHLVLGEWAYYVAIMGLPSATEPWGWQFQGPHAIINYFVLGDQVVMTPLFLGSEPAHATTGKYKGLCVLQQEQAAGLGLVTTLTDHQRQAAILSSTKTGPNNLSEAFRDNVVLDYAGLRADALSPASRGRMRDLIDLYVSNMAQGHARVRMDEIDRHLDDTHFAWIGGTRRDSVFYYRIQSPVLLIEFDHQPPVGLAPFFADQDAPTQQHVHTVVRTPNGNDYGKDLLRQHYLLHPHQP